MLREPDRRSQQSAASPVPGEQVRQQGVQLLHARWPADHGVLQPLPQRESPAHQVHHSQEGLWKSLDAGSQRPDLESVPQGQTGGAQEQSTDQAGTMLDLESPR